MSSDHTIGVVPIAAALTSPADRRRLGCWARSRGQTLDWETPDRHQAVVINPLSDLSRWIDWRSRSRSRRLVLDVVDFRYLEVAMQPGRGLPDLARNAGRVVIHGSGKSRVPWPGFSTRLRKALTIADAVTCSSPEQAAFLADYDIPSHAILDCHEEIPLVAPRIDNDTGSLKLLWEGQYYTLRFVNDLASGLRQVVQETAVELHLCTDPSGYRFANRFGRTTPEQILKPLTKIQGLSISVTPWSTHALDSLSRRIDAAVLPISRSDSAAWQKAENRTLIMWRLGLPVLMSATPAYERVAEEAGVDGLADSDADWGSLLSRLSDKNWRYQQAIHGHEYAIKRHDPEMVHAKWDRVFSALE